MIEYKDIVYSRILIYIDDYKNHKDHKDHKEAINNINNNQNIIGNIFKTLNTDLK